MYMKVYMVRDIIYGLNRENSDVTANFWNFFCYMYFFTFKSQIYCYRLWCKVYVCSNLMIFS